MIVKSLVSQVVATAARVAATLVLVAGAPVAFAQQQTLLNASYDVAREFYKDYDAVFVKSWKQKTGQDVTINQSHDGSSKQARSVADGLEADVVTMNSANDIDFLASRGMVPANWATLFPDHASPTYSTMLFLVRKGNPKGIKDWDDLAKPGLQIVIVNPKTGGNGRYSYMGAWGWAKKKGMSDADAAVFVGKIFRNVPVLDTGGRGATTTFLQRNIGDVLVTFESEVVQVDREFGAGKVDAVYPSVSVLAENPVAVIDRVVQKKGTAALAKAYLDGLYADDAQEIAAKHFLRVRSQKVMAAHAAEFKPIALFTVDEMFGSWKEAQAKHFNDGGEFDKIMTEIGKR
jgi:sulfate/thiosulfate transport system substrate-binding protein